MKNNKKGLSTIVATLLIILLTLVAVGIIWIVIKNVIIGGTDDVDYQTKCLATEVKATKVTNATADNFAVTFTTETGKYEIGGVNIVFTNAEGVGNVVYDLRANATYPMTALSTSTVTINVPTATLPNPNKVSIVAYFLSDSGEEQICTTASQFNFIPTYA